MVKNRLKEIEDAINSGKFPHCSISNKIAIKRLISEKKGILEGIKMVEELIKSRGFQYCPICDSTDDKNCNLCNGRPVIVIKESFFEEIKELKK